MTIVCLLNASCYNVSMKLSDFDYDLPKELIAQTPAEKRDHSRLMILDRRSQKISHDYFYNLKKYLESDDLLVFNQTKVFPARLYGSKPTGGKVEILLLNITPSDPPLNLRGGRKGELLLESSNVWSFIGKNIGPAKKIIFDGGLVGDIQNGQIIFNCNNAELMGRLDNIGHTPLPPYIRSQDAGRRTQNTRRRYQTVYAKEVGSAAAPTAGFHFTQELMDSIPNKSFVTLHVGLGTFAPVKTPIIEDHVMHSEHFEISDSARGQVLSARRVVAVGTTSVKVLESDWSKNETNIFIYPGYKFKHVDAMITNFHLPKSTLLMLVSAFASHALIMEAYHEAITHKYRFFSFGDAMIII